MLALAALGLSLTGVFGVRLLRGYLIDQVDEELAAAVALVSGKDVAGSQPQTTTVPSQFHVTVLDRRGDTVWAAPSALAESVPDLPHLTPGESVRRAGDPFTVSAVRGHDSWRAVALPVADGSGSLVMATSLDEVDATVDRLVRIDLLVGLAVLGGLAVVGTSMVRTALRPLSEIELTAAAIGRGDLARRVPDHHPGTEMGRLSRALNAMLEQIERAFQARASSEARARGSEERMRRFVADASHELRTPLTSIRGFAELHRQGAVTDPTEVAHLVARIEDEAKRMGLLVDDLLLLARLDQQRPLQLAPVDVAEVARSAVTAARATAPDRDVALVIDGRPDTDRDALGPATPGGPRAELTVAGDEPRLHQVLANLLDNALAYSPADSPVTVAVRAAEQDGQRLVALEVADRGPGLTPEQSARVFERFYRVDAARSRARGGTGLGLSIVAAIAEAHGGRVEVDSSPGEGSTFRVLVPATDADRRSPRPGADERPSA
ncbi:MAG: HAMP domain-containing histidine kinase [Acidimicrobiales bacterium]|nr:HAMP domain-containing histidine kinase [Acidimicrobiales bacterium]